MIKKKKIVLISSYCDTQEKIDILEKNIANVKMCGIDVMLLTPIVLPDSIQNSCDYYINTKENPVLDWPERAIFFWKTLKLKDNEIKITTTVPDYGWAGLYQVKKMSEIALTYDYDYFYHMIYDLKFDETIFEGLMSQKNCEVYASKRNETKWEAGLHFMIFNRENLETFISHIKLESYLKKNNSDAFIWLSELRETFPYSIAEKTVEDEIYYYEKIDFFNVSPIKNLKIFIEKNDEEDTTVKLLLYDIVKSENLILKIGEEKWEFQVNGNTLIDLGFGKKTIKPVWIEYENVTHELTDTIKKIKHNTLEKYD